MPNYQLNNTAIKVIVTDIEGTTSSLSFVKDVLFPYARQHMAAFIHAEHNKTEVKSLIEDVKQEILSQSANAKKPVETISLNDVIAQLDSWIDNDKKITPLKALQGLLWQNGYAQGDFKGHIYLDAYQQLKQWHEDGILLYVYSSGSVYAQKLLFSHTEYGDLTPLFTGYFDTKIGAKTESQSYKNIIESIKHQKQSINNDQILFLSDIEAELEAASTADIQTIGLARDVENKETNNDISKHLYVNNFETIFIN